MAPSRAAPKRTAGVVPLVTGSDAFSTSAVKWPPVAAMRPSGWIKALTPTVDT